MTRRTRWLFLCTTAALIGLTIPAFLLVEKWGTSRRPAEFYLIRDGMTREEVVEAMGRQPQQRPAPQVWWFQVGDGSIGVWFDSDDQAGQVHDVQWLPPPSFFQQARGWLGL